MQRSYRGCPICGRYLPEGRKQEEHGQTWDVYTCQNCRSEIWVDPFKGIRKDKPKGLFAFLRQ